MLNNIANNSKIDVNVEFVDQSLLFNQKSFKQETEYKDRENEVVKM